MKVVSIRRGLAAISTIIVAAFAGMSTAQADVISSTPTLPLLDAPYASSTGAGCFTAENVCISSGALTLTSVVSSTFSGSGQDIVTDASYTGLLTNLSNVPIGTVQLTGTVEQEVLARVSSTETGSWTSELLDLSLSGPLLGHTLTLTLDGSETSTGITSIVPAGGGTFRIDSFFDVFVDLSLNTPTPLTATRGPILVTAEAAVPEPATAALLGMGLVGLGVISRRRKVA